MVLWLYHTTPRGSKCEKSPHRWRRFRHFTMSASMCGCNVPPTFGVLLWISGNHKYFNCVWCDGALYMPWYLAHILYGFSGKPPIVHVVPHSESWPHTWPHPGALPEQERQHICCKCLVHVCYLYYSHFVFTINSHHLFKLKHLVPHITQGGMTSPLQHVVVAEDFSITPAPIHHDLTLGFR